MEKRKNLNKTKLKYFVLIVLAFGSGISITYSYNLLNEFRNKYFVNVSWKDFTKHYINSKKTTCETIKISINDKNFKKLNSQRINALNDNKDFKYVSGLIALNKDTSKIKIKIKLKGDRFVHFENETGWSFRIKTKNTVENIPPKFSLHHPKTKNYIYEWLFHEVLKNEGIIALNYNFYQVVVNAVDWGIYALEEHFTDELLESNNRIAGPIFSVKEEYGAMFSETPLVLPYNTEYVKNHKNDSIVTFATKKLYSFYSGSVNIEEVFNSKLMAKYFAICDLLSTHHGTVFKSLRLYFNPETEKFEPIGFDGHYGTDWVESTISSEYSYLPFSGWNYQHDSTWYQLFFQSRNPTDTVFHASYYNYLNQFSEKSYLDILFQETLVKLNSNMAIIYKDFPPKADHIFNYGPDFFNFNKYIYYDNQSRIKELINKEFKIHSFFEIVNDSMISLRINNISKFSIKINKLIANESQSLSLQYIIPPSKAYAYETIMVKTNGIIIDDLKIEFNIIGCNKLINQGVKLLN